MWRLYARKANKIAGGSEISVLVTNMLEVITNTALTDCWGIILLLKAFVNIEFNREAIVAHFAMPQGCASSAYNFSYPFLLITPSCAEVVHFLSNRRPFMSYSIAVFHRICYTRFAYIYKHSSQKLQSQLGQTV